MRYGIIVGGIGGKVTEPTDVPGYGQANPVAWLNQYRFAGQWLQVSDDAVPGATYNGGGSSTNPTNPDPPKQSRILSATSFMDAAIAGLRAANGSTQAAAEARFQEIIEGAKNFAGTTETARRIRYVHERYAKAPTFNKSVVVGMLALFRAAGVASITSDEETGILAAWPEVI